MDTGPSVMDALNESLEPNPVIIISCLSESEIRAMNDSSVRLLISSLMAFAVVVGEMANSNNGESGVVR